MLKKAGLLGITAIFLASAGCSPGDNGSPLSPVFDLIGRVFGSPQQRVSVTNVTMNIEGVGSVGTAGDGTFTLNGVPTGERRLIAQLPDGSQTIYKLMVPQGVKRVDAEFFVDPIAASSGIPGVTATPTLTAPAGTATITEPQNGGTITCAPPPAVCRFQVQGKASPMLGQPGTTFSVYVSVTPISPSGGGTFPQFPRVSVDPVTGEWRAEAQIGSEAFQAQRGDTFQIVAIVTSATLTQGTTMTPLRFDRPLDIPGVVQISPFINLVVGPRPIGLELVVLEVPPNSACERLTVTFQWRIDNRHAGVTYCSDVITDKGVNPFDGRFEEVFHAGQATALQVPLNPRVYDPASFEWGVRVTACQTLGALCENRDPPCAGQSFESDVRRLRTSSAAPNCP